MDEAKISRRIALLSNVNMNAVIRVLGKQAERAAAEACGGNDDRNSDSSRGGESDSNSNDSGSGSSIVGIEVFETEGYGNELGIMMNPDSAYHAFHPEITFLVMDLMELLEHELEERAAERHVSEWFAGFEQTLDAAQTYYINDAYLWGVEAEAASALAGRAVLEEIWGRKLREFCAHYANVRILPYRDMITRLGEENAFSLKMWYMGKMLLSGEACNRLAELILDKVRLESRTAKKVLALDLDNTLWGGLAGEHDNTPILLSEDHAGLAYKNLQRVLLQMQRQGVLLVIVSKNNPEDAEEILRDHPHMVLRPECFAAKRINWNPKNENIAEIASELNLGLDSFVFWDDNPQERLLVQDLLPMVEVPDFPTRPEELAPAMMEIYRKYFAKPVLTAEDVEKTRQYADNARRDTMKQSAASFEEYLERLQIVVTRETAAEHINRLEAMINKTNQFNLTTRRHTLSEIQAIAAKDEGKRVFLYSVKDCFGDLGVVAAVIVDVTQEVPVIEEFVMSCRVMGKNIEQGIVADVEQELRQEGFERVRGIYLPTARNKPVAELYDRLGYKELPKAAENSDQLGMQQTGSAENGDQRGMQQTEVAETFARLGWELTENEKTGCKVYELSLRTSPERGFVGTLQ